MRFRFNYLLVEKKNRLVYANYPVRVFAHPSINIYKKPLTYPYGSDTVLYYTDESGQMILEARSRTGDQHPIYFDVGGIKYKVFLGDS